MTSFGPASVRDDFRCSLCRQKNTFHCEHDTPYRDQILGTYDQEKPSTIATNSRRDPRQAQSYDNNHNNSTNNNKMQHTNPGRNRNPNSDDLYYQESKPVNSSYSTTDPYGYNYSRTNEPTKKNKSCVIL